MYCHLVVYMLGNLCWCGTLSAMEIFSGSEDLMTE